MHAIFQKIKLNEQWSAKPVCGSGRENPQLFQIVVANIVILLQEVENITIVLYQPLYIAREQ